MIKVLVADAHPIVRQKLRQLLNEAADVFTMGEAGYAAEVLEQAAKNDYDVILLDISMPGKPGLDILRQLKNEKPDVHVLILSAYPEEQYAMRALKAGAAGYLTKASAPEELITAIREIAMGRKYVSAALLKSPLLF